MDKLTGNDLKINDLTKTFWGHKVKIVKELAGNETVRNFNCEITEHFNEYYPKGSTIKTTVFRNETIELIDSLVRSDLMFAPAGPASTRTATSAPPRGPAWPPRRSAEGGSPRRSTAVQKH